MSASEMLTDEFNHSRGCHLQDMLERLNAGFLKIPDVSGGLAWFLTQYVDLRADESEGVDDDFFLHFLDGVNDESDGARIQLLERLLCVNIHT